MLLRVILFLLLNFAALSIGGMFTGPGVTSEWFAGLQQAPWNPPGWVFGAAWTTIMVCLAFYMANWWQEDPDKRSVAGQYALQWILNVGWNPVFFLWQASLPALFIIIALTLLVGYWLFRHASRMRSRTILLAPYFLWLLVATSLNAYIVFHN